MGVLPDIAAGVGVDIPSAGHVISVYALGVVVGAPVIAALSARLPRRALLVALMAAFLVGNVLTAARARLPHAARRPLPERPARTAPTSASPRWSPPRWWRRTCAAGPSARSSSASPRAMLTGVPAATWLGQQLGWRSAYWLSSSSRADHGRRRARRRPVVPGPARGDRPRRAAAPCSGRR